MDKISFNDFKEICELNFDRKHVKEILNTIENSDCLFHPGIIMQNEHIASLYKFRLQNAKENNKLEKEFLNDYENTVAALCNTQSKDLALTTLYNEQYSFIIFYEPVTKKILGVLKSKNPSSLQEIEEENSNTVHKGLSASFQKYSKGKFVKE